MENLKVCRNVNIELFNFYLKYFLVFLKNKCVISDDEVTDISLSQSMNYRYKIIELSNNRIISFDVYNIFWLRLENTRKPKQQKQ